MEDARPITHWKSAEEADPIADMVARWGEYALVMVGPHPAAQERVRLLLGQRQPAPAPKQPARG